MFCYRICGLSVASEFPLPGVGIAGSVDVPGDVQLRYGTIPEALHQAHHVAGNWQLNDTEFLLRIPQVARFLVTDGKEIIVDLNHSASDADAAPFLLGTAFGALLHQRGHLVLHAATVSYGGKGLAFCGASGIGKSTLAAALCQVGCDFVGDDVAAIQFDAQETPTIPPDGRQHRLWMDAAEQLGLTDRLGSAVRPCFKKFHVDPPGVIEQAPTPLAAIFILREMRSPGDLDLAPLGMADAASLIQREVYRPALAKRLRGQGSLFRQIAALLRQVRVFRVDRSMDFAMLDKTVAAILAQCGESA